MSDRKRALQRLEISREAVRLFREQGVAATSGEQIAAAVGLSVRTLWRYFHGKESCVEPLLAQTVETFLDVLRSCPPDRELHEHILTAHEDADPRVRADNAAALAVLALSVDERALRAVWLVVYERAETVLADLLATRAGTAPDDLAVRVQAAAIAAAVRISTEQLATAALADPSVELDTPEARSRLVAALRVATRTLP